MQNQKQNAHRSQSSSYYNLLSGPWGDLYCILYIDYRQENTMFEHLKKHISRAILLTTASTNGKVSGCSNIRPPATLNVTSSSIWCSLPSIRLGNSVNEKHEDPSRQYARVYQAIYNLLWYDIEINLQHKISPNYSTCRRTR